MVQVSQEKVAGFALFLRGRGTVHGGGRGRLEVVRGVIGTAGMRTGMMLWVVLVMVMMRMR
jgi:hypothetical protein